MITIGLTGKAGAGKSTVADHLVAEYGFTKVSFAAPLKQMLRTLDPIVDNPDGHVAVTLHEVFSAYDGSEALVKQSMYGPEYRRLLQVLGTDCIRAVDEDFWITAAMKQLTDPDGRYVFDDVRFPNEADAVDRLWNISRPGMLDLAGTHASEQHAGNMGEDLTITNDGSPGLLRWRTDMAIVAVLGL